MSVANIEEFTIISFFKILSNSLAAVDSSGPCEVAFGFPTFWAGKGDVPSRALLLHFLFDRFV